MLSLPQESSIDVNLLERMQEENIVTSYKLFWFRGIFKEIINQNKEITFRRIVCRMIAEAWYPLIEYHLNFGAIDHFIPWSFVLHDELWNLVPTFHNINSSKNNRLPNLERYMEKFCDLQYNAFKVARNNKKLKKQLEDYLTINKSMDINALLHKDIHKGYFVDSIKATIKPLFQIAYNQGYGLWHEDTTDNGIIISSVTNKISLDEIHTLKY